MGGRFGSIQARSVKRTHKWVCHVVPAYPNVSPGPMNGSILLRWANVSCTANFSVGGFDLKRPVPPSPARQTEGTANKTFRGMSPGSAARWAGHRRCSTQDSDNAVRRSVTYPAGCSPSRCTLASQVARLLITSAQDSGASRLSKLERVRQARLRPASSSWSRTSSEGGGFFQCTILDLTS